MVWGVGRAPCAESVADLTIGETHIIEITQTNNSDTTLLFDKSKESLGPRLLDILRIFHRALWRGVTGGVV